ncbi:hypothetical protein CJO79_06920 [Ralstonia solanacearum]|nr:hypothetical protein CJO76_06930 [Ralstonia solanacearum]AXV90746.1 hypothetical protein CJO79_06920 [Ralstonia solanacearum]AXW18907.1 hypothetical protein CJO85_06960 [Ralstonia solanacearum]
MFADCRATKRFMAPPSSVGISPWPHPRKISRFMRTLGHAFDGNPIDLIVLESSYQYGFTHMGESVLLC